MRKTLLSHYHLSASEHRLLETLHYKEFDATGDDYIFLKGLAQLISDMDAEIGRAKQEHDCDREWND